MNSVKVISLCLSLLVCGIIDVNAQWVQSGNTLTTPATELILNSNSDPGSTIWLNNKSAGPGSRGQYHIKSFDWWGQPFISKGQAIKMMRE